MRGFDPEKFKQAKAQALANQPRLGFRPRSAGEEQERPARGQGLGFGPTSALAAHKAQAQNQAPDTIPGMFKPGEFVLPPDTVHAMGGPAALQATVDATHTPALEQAIVPRGFKPKVFFANGGSTEDEPRRNSFGDAAAAASDGSVTQVKGLSPSPSSPSNTFPGNRLQGNSGSSGIPISQAARIAAAPAAAPTEPRGFSYADNNASNGQGIKDAWNRGEYGEAAGRTIAGTASMFTTPIADMAARGTSAAWDGAKGFGRGMFGSAAQAATPPAAATAARAPGAAAAPTSSASVVDQASAITPRPASYEYGPPGHLAAPQPNVTEVSPGVFRSGNSFGDSQAAATAGFEPRGLPSARSNAAAENLAAHSSARGFQPGMRTQVEQPGLGFPARGFEAPVARHSGNDWQARKDLANLETGASSIMNRSDFAGAGMGRFRGGGQQVGTSPAVAAYQAALQTDAALRQSQPGLDAEALRQNAGLAREGLQQAGGIARESMQQAGETGRTGMRLGVEQQRVGLEQQRVAGEQTARGFKTRAAAQEEALRSTLVDPNATAQQKQQAQQSLRALSGQAEQSPWKVTVTPAIKNADGSTTQGSIIRHNAVTGEVQQVEGGNTAQPSANHIAALRANPGQAAMFDEIYGKGAAARVIAAR